MFIELNIVGTEYRRYSTDGINLAINGEDGEEIEHIIPALFNTDQIKAVVKSAYDDGLTLIDMGKTKFVVKNTYDEVKGLIRISNL